jgi:membrane-associated phospholipid phosphatase
LEHARLPARAQTKVAGAVAAAALCFIGLVLTWVVPELVQTVRTTEATALHEFALLSTSQMRPITRALLELFEDRALFAIWSLILIAIAVARGGGRVAFAVGLVLVLAPSSSELLKRVLAHSHYVSEPGLRIGASTWPSATSTVALALVLCGALVAPRRLRSAVAICGGLLALAVGCALLIRHAHAPSDVLGGYFMAGLWAATSLAARSEERRVGKEC